MFDSRKNRLFLETALTAHFITRAQHQELVDTLKKEEQNGQAVSVISLFKTNRLLSQEDIQFVCELMAHIEERHLDHIFGKLAVANQFTSQAAIDRVLTVQAEAFKNRKKPPRIGEILVESGEITEAQLWAVLITQNRVRDDELMNAIRQLGDNELQKRNINKRFGAIMVNKKMLTIDQVNQALAIQADETRHGKAKRFIGEILKETYGIADELIQEVLQEQKKLEVNWLKLEKHLSAFNTGIRFFEKMDTLFEESISEDKLEAAVKLKQSPAEAVTSKQLIKWLLFIGIRFGLVEDSQMDTFLTEAVPGSELKVAQGEAPTPGKEGTITYHFDASVSDLSDEEQLKKTGRKVHKGEVIAVITEPIAGKPGKDVFGRVIPPPIPAQNLIWRGKGVRKEGGNFIAEIEGYPVWYKNRTILILPSDPAGDILHIQGDLETETATTLNADHVIIDGRIPSGATAKCHHLTVNGGIFGKVIATGDVVVKGGIGEAAGTTTAETIPTSITATGRITIAKYINRAEICSSGSIIAPGCCVTAARLTAKNEIVLKEVLADEEEQVEIIIGIGEEERIAEIEAEIEKWDLKLKELRSRDTRVEMEKKVNFAIQVQDQARERQNVLKFFIEAARTMQSLWSILDEENLSPSETIEKLRVQYSWETNAVGCPQAGTKAYEYGKELVAAMKPLEVERRIEFLKKKHQNGIQDYRAAIRAVELAETESQTINQPALPQDTPEEAEMEVIQNEIERLAVEKDRIAFVMDRNARFPTGLKVKRKISRGVIVRSRNTSMKIQKDFYGVSIREVRHHDNTWELIIENYYQ